MTPLAVALLVLAGVVVGVVSTVIGVSVWLATQVTTINARRLAAKGSKGE